MKEVVLKGKEREAYNKIEYSDQWLTASSQRLVSDYYKKDHFQDTLNTILDARGAKVLECGIGTGEFFALGLARGGKAVYGIDFCGNLLSDCQKRFHSERMPVRLSLADVNNIPFREGSFDITFAIGVMPYVDAVPKAIREMLRVTKKGGMVVFDFMNPWHISQITNYWYRFLEGSQLGFRAIRWLKECKRSLGFKTHFKAAPEKINFRLISPLRMLRALKKTGLDFRVKGYNVLLPVNMPILGSRANICDRLRFFSYGLKNNRVLKYFGSKLVVTITKM